VYVLIPIKTNPENFGTIHPGYLVDKAEQQRKNDWEVFFG